MALLPGGYRCSIPTTSTSCNVPSFFAAGTGLLGYPSLEPPGRLANGISEPFQLMDFLVMGPGTWWVPGEYLVGSWSHRLAQTPALAPHSLRRGSRLASDTLQQLCVTSLMEILKGDMWFRPCKNRLSPMKFWLTFVHLQENRVAKKQVGKLSRNEAH